MDWLIEIVMRAGFTIGLVLFVGAVLGAGGGSDFDTKDPGDY